MNTLVRLMLQSTFEEGLFHADPHPGNVFVLPDGRLSLLDFGNTGEFDEPMRESLILLLEAVVKGDARAATEAYLEMAPATEDVNRTALLADIKTALYDIRRSDLAEVSIRNGNLPLCSRPVRTGCVRCRTDAGGMAAYIGPIGTDSKASLCCVAGGFNG
jgi:predicted unusual protein kinase regulating ubiquinone biosynthesis (AarF/ABC1/UbiB family)